MENRLVLVTGVTGYIGGRLVPQLIEAGYRVEYSFEIATACKAVPGSIK